MSEHAAMSPCLWHHGIKGMKWGIRRTPEELARARGEILETKTNSVILSDGVYSSDKGFTCAEAKMSGYCLKPGAKHSQEFYDVGYKPTDSELLINDINAGYDYSKAIIRGSDSQNFSKFEIDMELGVTEKRNFVTTWAVMKEGDKPKLTSAFRRSPKRKED